VKKCGREVINDEERKEKVKRRRKKTHTIAVRNNSNFAAWNVDKINKIEFHELFCKYPTQRAISFFFESSV